MVRRAHLFALDNSSATDAFPALGYAFWIPVVFCFISVLITLGYIWFDAHVVPKHIRLTSNKAAAQAASSHVAKKKFSLGTYWLLPCE